MNNLLSGWRRFFASNNLRKNVGYASEDRLSANVLASLLLATGLILICIVTPRHFINPAPDVTTRALLSFAGGVSALVASYFCRHGYHHVIINATIVIIPGWIISASVTRTGSDALLPLYYLSPVFIFVSMFLTQRMMVASFVVNTLTLIICILVLPTIPLIRFMEGPFSFHVIVSILTFLMVRYRRALEALRKRELEASEIRFRSVIDRSQDEFYLFTAVRNPAGQVIDFRMIDSNDKAGVILEHYSSQIGDRTLNVRLLSSLYDGAMKDRLFALYKTVLETGQTQTGEVAAHINPTTQRWYYRQVLRVGDGVAVLMRDITPSKLAEQRTLELGLQREKVSILHTFIQDASHDLRTPLAVMRTSSYLLNALADRLRKLLIEDDLTPRRTDLSTVTEKMHQNTQQVVQSSERLHRLIEDMLEMTSLDYRAEFTFVPRSLNSVLHTLVDKSQSLIERKKLTLTYTPSVQPVQVSIDESALSHALDHLLNNAVQFTPAGGEIALSVIQQDDQVAVEIKDTGIGIAADEMPRIFERFYRADRARQQSTGGTGLGLPIAQKIIEEHGGKITVESAEGHGSTFRVWLTPLPSPVPTPALTTQPTL